jgi:hypothetical protein
MMNKGRRMAEFIDGTSKTAAVSELRTIPGEDTRGVLHFGAGCLYMHDFPPNFTGLPDRSRYCADTLPDYAPCIEPSGQWKGGWRHFARSAHSGGVNLMMVDTSVRFVSENVNETLWSAIATPTGAEALTDSI